MTTADIGVFGGPGFYDFLDDVEEVVVDTGLEGAEGIEPVTMAEVFAFLETNVEQVRSVLFDVIPKIPTERTGCACADAVGLLPT